MSSKWGKILTKVTIAQNVILGGLASYVSYGIVFIMHLSAHSGHSGHFTHHLLTPSCPCSF